jgi:hypothetical protein
MPHFHSRRLTMRPVVFRKVLINRSTHRSVVRRVRPIPMDPSSLQGPLVTRILLSKRDKYFGSLSFVATGVMTIHGRISAFVEIRAMSRDGQIPDVFDISANEEIVDLASRRKWVWLTLLGFRLKADVVGRNNSNDFPALLVAAEPLFRALAKASRKRKRRH